MRPWETEKFHASLEYSNISPMETPQGLFSFLNAYCRNMAKVDFFKKGKYLQEYIWEEIKN